MLTENHIHTLNDLLIEQGEQLLAAQKMVALCTTSSAGEKDQEGGSAQEIILRAHLQQVCRWVYL